MTQKHTMGTGEATGDTEGLLPSVFLSTLPMSLRRFV